MYENLQPTTYNLQRRRLGFTLIELSIVLVIIGLITGGILVGNDLVAAAKIRSTVSQIESYNTATRTFQLKYGGLPGDIAADLVTQYGFSVMPNRAGTGGQGDGNGFIQAYGYASNNYYAQQACCISGETAWFWEDLSSNSGLISGNFNYAGAFDYPLGGVNEQTIPTIQDIIPRAKIKDSVYFNVYSLGGFNYFSLLAFGEGGSIGLNGGIRNNSTALSVNEAASIDKKLDDGLPQTGNVIARYQQWDLAGEGATTTGGLVWASGGMVEGTTDTSAAPASAITCYDNGGAAGTQKYSVGTNGGKGLNCALSFKMQ